MKYTAANNVYPSVGIQDGGNHSSVYSVLCVWHYPGVQGYHGASGTGSCLSFVIESNAHHHIPDTDIQVLRAVFIRL